VGCFGVLRLRSRMLSCSFAQYDRVRRGVEGEAELDELEVPVAELAPEELVDGVGGFVETIVGERVGDAVGDGAEAREDPAGFEGCVLGKVDGERVVAAERDPVASFAAA